MQKIIYTITAVLLFGNLYAQRRPDMKEQLDIKTAVRIALDNNYSIKVANNQRKQAENNATAGNAGLLPSLKTTATSNYSDNETAGDISQKRTDNNASIGLSYVLFNGLGRLYSFDKLKTLAEGSEIQARGLIENLLMQVISGFYNTAQSYESLQRAGEMLDISRERLERAEAKTEIIAGSSLDVLNARVDFNKDSVNYINSLNQYESFKRTLNTLLGRQANTPFDVLPDRDMKFQHFVPSVLEKDVLNNNADYLAQTYKLKESELDYKITKSARFPSLSFNSSYGYNTAYSKLKVGTDDSKARIAAGLSLSFNIFDGRKQRIKERNAKINIENTQFSLEEKKLNLLKNLEDALADYKNAVTVLNTERNNLKSAEANFSQSKEYYNLGQISSTRFREAQLNLITAKNNISTALYKAKIAEAEILRLKGDLLSEAE